MKNYFTIRILFSNLFLTSLVIPQSQLSLKNDNIQIKEDESVEIDILKNDNIRDKSNLIIEIISNPEKGNVKIQGNNLIYTPNPDENGVDKLKYKSSTHFLSKTLSCILISLFIIKKIIIYYCLSSPDDGS